MLSKKNILDFETRREIYEFIQENPGLNIREISRRTEVPKTTLLHHLRFLEKQELVELKSKGRYRFIYAKYELGSQDREILELLRTKVPCRILLHLFFTISCSQIELSRELDLHPVLVSYHLKKMMEMGIIEKTTAENGIIYPYPGPNDKRIVCRKPQGREIFYRRKNQKIFDSVSRIMIAHKDSLADAQYIDEYFSYMQSLIDMGVIKEMYKSKEIRVVEKDGKKVSHFRLPSGENIYNAFMEIFRPPFCA